MDTCRRRAAAVRARVQNGSVISPVVRDTCAGGGIDWGRNIQTESGRRAVYLGGTGAPHGAAARRRRATTRRRITRCHATPPPHLGHACRLRRCACARRRRVFGACGVSCDRQENGCARVGDRGPSSRQTPTTGTDVGVTCGVRMDRRRFFFRVATDATGATDATDAADGRRAFFFVFLGGFACLGSVVVCVCW